MEWRRPLADSASRKELPTFAPCVGFEGRGHSARHNGKETAMYRFATTMMIVAVGLGYQLANAAPSDDVPSVVVRFTDQDLAHINGVAALYRSLKDAAKTVCVAHDGPRYKVCWQSALSAAVARVDHPALTAYYRAQFESRNATIQIAQK